MSRHHTNGSNGNGRQVRIDRRGGAFTQPGPDSGSILGSGRVLVSIIIVAVLLLWGGLNLVFREWRTAYRERAAYGVKVVADAIDPLAEVVPSGEGSPGERTVNSAGIAAAIAGYASPDVTPEAWKKAVEQTHKMLVTVTAANLLDREQMTALGSHVAERVERSKKNPETARRELAGLWDEMSASAGLVVENRHPRPVVLPAKVKKADAR